MKFIQFIGTCGLVAALPLCCCSAATVPGTLPGVVVKVLPNGLRLIVREQKASPLAAIDVWVRAGSGHELPNESGAAHFLEHMLFKGTTTRKSGEVDAAIEDLGGTLSAGTNRNGAHFYTTIAEPDVDAALEVLADVMQHASIDQVEMERERAVILDEIARSKNDKYASIETRLFESVFKSSPLSRPILGERESLTTLNRETVVKFYDRLFVPNNTTVVIVGKISPGRAEELIVKRFGAWTKREFSAIGKANPSEALNSTKEPNFRPEVGVRVGVALAVNPAGDVNAGLSARLLAGILSSQGFGQVNDALKRAGVVQGPVIIDPSRPSFAPAPVPEPPDVRSELVEIGAGGLFLVHVEVAAAQREIASRVIMTSLDELQRNAVTATELSAAKYRLLGSFVADAETYAGQARLLGLWDVLGDYKTAEEFGTRLLKIKAADLTEYAKSWFEPARLHEAIVTVKGP